MKITQEEVVERQTVLHIELEDEDLDPYLDRGYKRVVQQVVVPGFRKGKAPRKILERYLGRESLLNEVLDFMLPDVTRQAIEAQELETAGQPNLEFLGLDPFSLKATVALTPQVELGEFKSIRVEEKPVEITEDDVQKRLDEMRKKAAPWEPVDRPVKLGDMVTMNVSGQVDGNEVLNEEDTVYVAEEDGVLPFPGFSKNLEGVVAGEPKAFDLLIPEDFADASVAGKQAHFHLSVSDVKEQAISELDDEFTKSVGDGFESMAALTESVQTELSKEAEEAQSAQFREESLEELIRVVDVELPPLLIDHEVEHMVARRDQFVDRLSITKEDYLRFTGKTEDEIQVEMRAEAVAKFTRSYAMLALAETEGLEVSEGEIDDKIKAIRDSQGQEADGLTLKELDSEEARSAIQETLLATKAVDRLTAIAKGGAEVEGDSAPRGETEPNEPEKGGSTGEPDA